MTRIFLLLALTIGFCPSFQAQSTCDSILIHSVQFDPLGGDSIINVVAENKSSNLISYPGFALLNGAGDTVAKETVNFFGMGSYPNGYAMKVIGNTPPTVIADGQLALHSNFYDSLECVFENDYSLCPEECAPMGVWIQGYGSPSTYHEYSYYIYDMIGAVVYANSLSIDSASPWSNDSICLPPGVYVINFYLDSAATNHLVHCFLQTPYGLWGERLVSPDPDASWSFEILKACEGDTVEPDGLTKLGPQQFCACFRNGNFQVNTLNQQDIDFVRLMNVSGQVLFESAPNAELMQIPTGNLPDGVYIIQAKVGRDHHVRKVMLAR